MGSNASLHTPNTANSNGSPGIKSGAESQESLAALPVAPASAKASLRCDHRIIDSERGALLEITISGRWGLEVAGQVAIYNLGPLGIGKTLTGVTNALASGEVLGVLQTIKDSSLDHTLKVRPSKAMANLVRSPQLARLGGSSPQFELTVSAPTDPASLSRILLGQEAAQFIFRVAGEQQGDVREILVERGPSALMITLQGQQATCLFKLPSATHANVITSLLAAIKNQPHYSTDVNTNRGFIGLLKLADAVTIYNAKIKALNLMGRSKPIELRFHCCDLDGVNLLGVSGLVECVGCYDIRAFVADGFRVKAGGALTFRDSSFAGNNNSLRHVAAVDVSERCQAHGVNLSGVARIIWPSQLIAASRRIAAAGHKSLEKADSPNIGPENQEAGAQRVRLQADETDRATPHGKSTSALLQHFARSLPLLASIARAFHSLSVKELTDARTVVDNKSEGDLNEDMRSAGHLIRENFAGALITPSSSSLAHEIVQSHSLPVESSRYQEVSIKALKDAAEHLTRSYPEIIKLADQSGGDSARDALVFRRIAADGVEEQLAFRVDIEGTGYTVQNARRLLAGTSCEPIITGEARQVCQSEGLRLLLEFLRGNSVQVLPDRDSVQFRSGDRGQFR